MHQRKKKQVAFSVAIGNELVQECFSKHLRMWTARMIEHKKTEEESKKRGVSMEKSKKSMKKEFMSADHYVINVKY